MEREHLKLLHRIAIALEAHMPPVAPAIDLAAADAFIWSADKRELKAVHKTSHIDISLLQGIERQKEVLWENTKYFSDGYLANNVLIWGARGTGKSSLVKAVHAEINRQKHGALALIEIYREDVHSLADLLEILETSDRRFVIYCDDLSFDANDNSYKSLKAVLDGGLRGRPENVLFYATSNRRHLLSRDMIENEQAAAVHAGEVNEEKISLSDRFGLWIGFHKHDQATYLDIVRTYAQHFNLGIDEDELKHHALEWSVTRGGRSGRVAWQFIQSAAAQYAHAVSSDDTREEGEGRPRKLHAS
ncbi:ATP-binding protein [uncultured Sneathiella sp.]|uniref:ATP-binding protein n=1 Tax=uncultured Sneathiella sp. TaxID=879315 RepID=UPI0030EEFBD0|tara:strand:- start:10045 stop:10953 length:909 start_codon:yes stop_codon:yes gene_type:complete